VVNLLQRDARGHHNVFHLGSVLNGSLRIGVKRLDKDAAIPACQSASFALSNPISIPTPPDSSNSQSFTIPRFALIRSNKVRHFLPSLDDTETLSWIPHNRR
jgi:hypothetical protein